MIELGGSLPDMKAEVPKTLKRSREDEKGTDKHETSMPHPQKRAKTGDSGIDEAPKTPVKTLFSSSDTTNHTSRMLTPVRTPPTQDGPSPQRLPLPVRHNTPVPKAKRANFFKTIPVGKEGKFASTRLAQPNMLRDATTSSSHVTAVFQGLAATTKAHEIWSDLSESEKQSRDFRLLRNDLNVSEINEEVSKQKELSPRRAIVDFITSAQVEHSTPLNAYPLQRHLKTAAPRSIADSIKYMKHVLSSASTPSLTHAFKAPNTYAFFCRECHETSPFDEDAHPARKPYKPPVKAITGTYITRFTPTFGDHELRYGKPASRDLGQLIASKHNNPIRSPCSTCRAHNTSNRIQTWVGWSYPPSILTLAFDRTTAAKQYKLTLPLEHDFQPIIHESGETFKYRLVTVIKKLRSGDYAAFVHAEDGKWWRCISEDVREVGIAEWQGDGGMGRVLWLCMRSWSREDGKDTKS